MIEKTEYKLRLGKQRDITQKQPFINRLKDRFNHTYIVGKTGCGKSTLLEHMANYDIDYGLATIFIDPKGESVKKIYELTEDKSRIIYISIKSPVVINPLNKDGYNIDNLIQEFIQILDVLITLTASNPESTVLMKMIIGYAMRAIKKEENKNIHYLTELLLYKEIRKKLVTDLVEHTDEHNYWSTFDHKDNWQTAESAKRVAARLSELSTGEMKDFIVGKNELDISDIVNNNKIVLVDTSRMNRNSRIYLSNLIVYAVLSYCDFAKNKINPLMVYVDEFSIVVSSLFSELLSRSRSSKVGFTLAHQNFQQIPKNILGSIFGNCDTFMTFRCGDEEAERLAPIFDLKTKDLFNLPKYQAMVRLGTDNILIKTYPPKLEDTPDLDISNPKQSYMFMGDEWYSF
jgi:type IV secretory pathway VirB4 component